MASNLSPGEEFVAQLRTHVKALFGTFLVLLLWMALMGVALAMLPRYLPEWNPWWVVGVLLLLMLLTTVLPFLKWLTHTYTITTHRITEAWGILNKNSRDIPLHRVNNITVERSVWDRMLGCGTLRIETASNQITVLDDVPKVKKVHRMLSSMLMRQNDAE